MAQIPRQFPRYPLLLCVDAGDGWNGWTENVSEAGIFVLSDEIPVEGEIRTLKFGLPGVLADFEVSGRVAWLRSASAWQPSGYGLALEQEVPIMKEIARACTDPAAPSRSARVLMVRVAMGAGQVAPGIELLIRDDTGQALDCARDNPGVVLISSVFPPLSECLSTLKAIQRAGASAVYGIASGDVDDDARALAAGVDAMLPRPLTVGPLLMSLGCLLRL